MKNETLRRSVIRTNAEVLWEEPPGVEHAIYNTGVTDLRFIVVTCPPEDE